MNCSYFGKSMGNCAICQLEIIELNPISEFKTKKKRANFMPLQWLIGCVWLRWNFRELVATREIKLSVAWFICGQCECLCRCVCGRWVSHQIVGSENYYIWKQKNTPFSDDQLSLWWCWLPMIHFRELYYEQMHGNLSVWLWNCHFGWRLISRSQKRGFQFTKECWQCFGNCPTNLKNELSFFSSLNELLHAYFLELAFSVEIFVIFQHSCSQINFPLFECQITFLNNENVYMFIMNIYIYM